MNFIDGAGSPWNVSVGDLGSPAALGYRYDDDTEPFAADLVMVTGDVMTEKLQAYRRLDTRAPSGSGLSANLRRIELSSGGTIYAAAADNDQVASRDRPIGISVPLGRPLGDIVGAQALAFRPDRPDAKQHRRYVWAALRDIEPPLDATTRVRVFVNCHELSPRTGLTIRATRPASAFLAASTSAMTRPAGAARFSAAMAAPRCTSTSRRRWPAWTIPEVSAPTG